ncbi:MAG: APC family permease [Elusimicrobiota bacterium]
MSSDPVPRRSSRRVTEVVVLTTAMLTFISFSRAAAIVLCDMASTMFYVAGIVEQAIGPAAPWFILAVMLFSSCVLAMYVEASIKFVRGGVYRVVKEAMGGSLAKISVSTLMFGFVLTGPISAVAAGQYLVGLLNSWLGASGAVVRLNPASFSVVFALIVTAYFWWQNTKGIRESSDKALKIMKLTAVMGVLLILWGGYSLYVRDVVLPPMMPVFTPDGLGWLEHVDWVKTVGGLGVMIAIGHSFLGMTGAETLAQVYREMEAPKVKNLKRAAVVIFLFAATMTSFSAFLGVMLIPGEVRAEYIDNLLAGVALQGLVGPLILRQVFHAFIVLVGVLILAGAVNTSIVGANGVLARLAEDGVLADWFRGLHPRYGTTHRMINLLVILQVITILFCGGDVYVLGEAYAFGVIWSFVFMALAVTVLRFRQTNGDDDSGEEGWRVPPTLRLGDIELPLGLFAVLAVLLMAGSLNLVTKKLATIWGGAFSLGFYLLIKFSEKLNEKKRQAQDEPREKLNLRHESELANASKELNKPRRILVAVRNPSNLYPLEKVLDDADTEETDVVVLHSKAAPPRSYGQEMGMGPAEEMLFTNVITLAEKYGKTVKPMFVVSDDPAYAVAQAAHSLGASEVVLGRSYRLGAETQIERIAMTWGALGQKFDQPVRVRVLWPEGKSMEAELM